MGEKAKKVLGVISDIVLIIIMLVSIVITILTFSSKANNNGVANILGYSPFAVKSDSMSPTFDKGDLIIVKTKDFDPLAFKVGDVITFYAEDVATGNMFINSHRIVKVEPFDDTNTYMFYTTKGDAYDDNDTTRVGSSEIIGYYSGTKVPVLGSVMDFLQTQTGFMVCVLIPLAIFFIWQVYKFFSILIESKKQKAIAEMERSINGISEEEKKRIAEEYLKQQAENSETDNKNEN